jgi:hypothetical protein
MYQIAFEIRQSPATRAARFKCAVGSVFQRDKLPVVELAQRLIRAMAVRAREW